MRVFISWSGPVAQQIAAELYEWLPIVLSGQVSCFMSEKDIEGGDRGLGKIAAELDDSQFGIAIVTPENVDSPWINFEAGAISKVVGSSKLVPLRLGLTATQVVGPLSQFQSRQLDSREEMFTLVREMAGNFPSLPEASVQSLFDSKWEQLETAVSLAQAAGEKAVPRDMNSMVQEVLELVRGLSQREMHSQVDTARLSNRNTQLRSSSPYMLLPDWSLAADGLTKNDASKSLFLMDAFLAWKKAQEQDAEPNDELTRPEDEGPEG